MEGLGLPIGIAILWLSYKLIIKILKKTYKEIKKQKDT